MTDRERFQLMELREKKAKEAVYQCSVCGKPIDQFNLQLAHKIIKSKINLKKYGKELIHHEDNLEAVCSLPCNSAVIVNYNEEKELVDAIRAKINGGKR